MKKYFFPMPFKRRWKYNLFENLFFLEIDPDIHRGFEFGEAKFVDVYAARYAGRTSFIRVAKLELSGSRHSIQKLKAKDSPLFIWERNWLSHL